MEVASPLQFNHVQAGSKRAFSCSTIVEAAGNGMMDATSEDYSMDVSSSYVHSFKRRRFGSGDIMETSHKSNETFNGFASPQPSTLVDTLSPTRSASAIWKRRRTEEISQGTSQQQHLQRTIERQAADIESLKKEKSAVETSFTTLKSDHEKHQHENRILKRAITIQQERQNQAGREIDAARQHNEKTDEHVKRLEQVIMTLRYHLQAQQPCTGNDFMGNRPPDVF